MRTPGAELFKGRHFDREVIILCVRWYISYKLSSRELVEMMGERGLAIDHSTIARWVLRYAPVLNDRIRSKMRQPNRSWPLTQRAQATPIAPVSWPGGCGCPTLRGSPNPGGPTRQTGGNLNLY